VTPVTIVPMQAEHRAAFFALHSEANGCGWCRCVAWWVESWDGWGERTAEENTCLREALFDRGQYDGYLAFAGERAVGWCQVGPRDRLEKLVGQFGLTRDPDVYAVTCFLVAPSHRRQGLTRRLLASVLDDLRTRGVQRVEAFPKRGDDLEAGELWTGPRAVFEAAGFQVVSEHERGPVLSKSL
jgi:GNAT superfamily N-acetyltransferase